jgi:hypothetical protein
MSKIFEYELTTKPGDLLKQAQQMAEKNGASFTIKHNYGKFDWNGIKGSMRVHEGKLIITILDKPFIIPWGVVENTINNFLAHSKH